MTPRLKVVKEPEVHLTTKELAKRWKISQQRLRVRRVNGNPPKFLKLGGKVLYPMTEIEAYEKSSMKRNTVS